MPPRLSDRGITYDAYRKARLVEILKENDSNDIIREKYDFYTLSFDFDRIRLNSGNEYFCERSTEEKGDYVVILRSSPAEITLDVHHEDLKVVAAVSVLPPQARITHGVVL